MDTASPRPAARSRSRSPSSPSRFRPRSSRAASRCSATSWMTRRCATCGSSISTARMNRCSRPPPTSARRRWRQTVKPMPTCRTRREPTGSTCSAIRTTVSPQPISGDGAAAPIWSRDGRELFFVADGQLMAVEIDLSERVPRPGPELGLFPRRSLPRVGHQRQPDVRRRR